MWKYMKNVLIWLDQGVNVILFLGYPDETLSARAYRHHLDGSMPYLKKIIDTLFWFDEDHCKKSYENEVLNRQLPPEYRDK